MDHASSFNTVSLYQVRSNSLSGKWGKEWNKGKDEARGQVYLMIIMVVDLREQSSHCSTYHRAGVLTIGTRSIRTRSNSHASCTAYPFILSTHLLNSYYLAHPLDLGEAHTLIEGTDTQMCYVSSLICLVTVVSDSL